MIIFRDRPSRSLKCIKKHMLYTGIYWITILLLVVYFKDLTSCSLILIIPSFAKNRDQRSTRLPGIQTHYKEYRALRRSPRQDSYKYPENGCRNHAMQCRPKPLHHFPNVWEIQSFISSLIWRNTLSCSSSDPTAAAGSSKLL